MSESHELFKHFMNEKRKLEQAKKRGSKYISEYEKDANSAFYEYKEKEIEEKEDDDNNKDIKKETNNGDFAEMMSILLHSRTQAHTLHLQTESYPEHMALNGYYDGIGDLVDGLVESFQGKYGIIKGYQSMDLQEWKSTEDTVKYMNGICTKIEELRDCCKDSYIQNQIDTVCELINSTIYKLRFLK